MTGKCVLRLVVCVGLAHVLGSASASMKTALHGTSTDRTHTTVRAASTGLGAPVTTELVATGFDVPVFATHAPGDFTRLFVVERGGVIRVLNLKTGVVNPAPFLSVAVVDTGEQGLLGLAFHPDYGNNGRFYVYYITPGTTPGGTSHVRQFQVSANPDLADPRSGVEVLAVDQPEDNHNGGWLGFGPLDGYLYIGLGDGGGGNDMHGLIGNGQAKNTLLGKLLRIDVDGDDFPSDPDRNYAIPPSNPFVADAGSLSEIWAYGLRNPWRCSFDRDTGDLFIADVGQNLWEEIDFQPAAGAGGENYGWRCYEATHDFNVENHCNSITHVLPIREYYHVGGRCSITGGYRYRGCAMPSWQGEYFFADWCTGEIFSFNDTAGSVDAFVDRTAELAPGGGSSIDNVNSFGEDARGELYLVDLDGDLFRIVPVTAVMSEADIDCSGSVAVNDLLDLLASWGDCDGCAADFDGDHQVSVVDLLFLLSRWG